MKILSVGFLSLMAVGAAWGQEPAADTTPIPEPLMKLEFQRCYKGCVADYGAPACTALCDCSMKQFQKRLTYNQYLDMARQMSANKLDAKNRKMLGDIAQYCSAELDKAGVPVAGEDAKAGDKPAAPGAKPEQKPDTPKSPQ